MPSCDFVLPLPIQIERAKAKCSSKVWIPETRSSRGDKQSYLMVWVFWMIICCFFFFFLAILLCLVVTSVSFLCCCAPPPVSLPPHTCLTSVSPPAPLPLISLLYISTSLLFPHSLLVRLLSPCFRLHASCAPVPVFAGPCVFTVFQISSLWFSGLLLVFALLWCFPLLTVLVASFCFCVSTFVTWISYFGVWLSVLKLRFYSLPAYLCVE